MRAKKFLILSIVSIFAALSFSFGGTSVAAAENETSDTLEMSMVCDWILDIKTHDYIKFEVIFKKDVFHAFPAGSEYRMLDGDDSQKAYMNNFTLCGKTFADINEEITAEDMADWEIAFFPATLGGVYLEPIIPHVHKPNQMQVCVHKEYVKMLTGDITFGIVEGAQFTTQEGESYVAGDNLLFTLPEDVKESTTGAWDTEEVESPVDEERKVGMSSVTNMRRDGSMTEYYITELFFSRDVFRTDSMKNLDYSIMDGTHGNYYFIAEFFKINGKTVKQINLETDDSLYEYITLKNYGDSLKQPILLVSLQPNKMTIALHEQYVADNDLLNTMSMSVADNFYVTVKSPSESGEDRYIRAGYSVEKEYVFTLNSEKTFDFDGTFEAYQQDREIIERKYTKEQMDALEYDTVTPHSISDIISLGDIRYYNGEKRTQAQYIVIYFDKDLCNQYIPYASGGKSYLVNLSLNPANTGVSLTKQQIDAYYDYHMDEYLINNIKIDGKTLAEIHDAETDPAIVPETAVRFHYAGSSSGTNSLVLYIEYNSVAWMDREKPHTVEILAGFRTPLFGEVKRDKKFVFTPSSYDWSTVNSGAEFADDNLVDKPADGGCNGSIGLSSAVAAAAAGIGAILIWRRKEHEEN